jgi:hypothetical protein
MEELGSAAAHPRERGEERGMDKVDMSENDRWGLLIIERLRVHFKSLLELLRVF